VNLLSPGEPHTTEELVRRTMERAYGLDFYAGDEDNGEMGSWYVMAALGLYSVAPGEFFFFNVLS
jgi:putative alpha-1,2-mannosidase